MLMRYVILLGAFVAVHANAAVPSVNAVTPENGPPVGGTSVSITGAAFTGATAVSFGTNAAVFTVLSDSTITANAPAQALAGTVDVTVTNQDGTSVTSVNDQYTYTAAPTVVAVSPNSGPTPGGTNVTLTGVSFAGTISVNFGITPATSFIVVNDTTITAISPAGTGTVDITVTTPSGTSATSAAAQFTYVATPVLLQSFGVD